MEERSSSPFKWTNLLWFFALSFLALQGYSALLNHFYPPKKPVPVAVVPPAAAKPAEKPLEKPKEPAAGVPEKTPKPEAKPPAEAKPGEAKPAAEAELKAAPAPAVPRQWVTLGSADPNDPYRMLVTLGNQGAALARIELSSPRYSDLEDRTGYLGHIVLEDNERGHGCPVQVVGKGTPAYKAGLQAGDRILTIGGKEVDGERGLEVALANTRPGRTIEMTVDRKGEKLSLSATLTRRPLEVVRPEARTPHVFTTTQRHADPVDLEDDAPLSLLATFDQIDGDKIPEPDDPDKPDMDKELNRELKGVDLRRANWEIVGQGDPTKVVFRHVLPSRGLEVTKTYTLDKVADGQGANGDASAYHLNFTLTVKNVGKEKREVAYRLDGPNGLPREGAWYASKVGIKGGAGLRDVVYQLTHGDVGMVTCTELAAKPILPLVNSAALTPEHRFQFFGVDAQYFSAAMIPGEENEKTFEIDRALAVRVGDVDPEQKTITNTSLRIISKPAVLQPGRELSGRYELFAGPKSRPLLTAYHLEGLLYYGWFGWVAVPMTHTLHFFYDIVHNYGLAIIMLTVLVRLCMFPMSRKQALNAQKMQELQPEIKRLQEKHKKDIEGRTKAQQELFRKHNYNPLSGCLVLFVQLPIFMGLYRSLQVDVELRDAGLFGHVIRWCSNLAAPDMLYDWSWFMPAWFSSGVGMFALGPYFNLLPLLTIGLFLWQQKMFMPPPTDEQSAMQAKMMNYMMVFMGVMFYKVASGLCIYFIASSLWGVAERKFLPKKTPVDAGDDQGSSSDPSNAAMRRRQSRGKK
jgi:YidC/Oxa1 family membrane protein insertase